MDFDLDAALRRVADDEHPGLGSIDAAVFHRVRANRTSARTGMGAVAFAAIGAISAKARRLQDYSCRAPIR